MAATTFDEKLDWAIECLFEAECSLRDALHQAGLEDRPLPVGKRLRLKADVIALQRPPLEEVRDGTLAGGGAGG